MNRVLITGATGFVGGALAAQFLAQGARVVAISRNDPDGVRTIATVLAAAKGCGLEIVGLLADRLDVIDVDFAELEMSLTADALGDVSEVWHVAAEMSYSAHKLAQSFRTNVGNTNSLYQQVCKHAPACRRFFYVSTAYVAGMSGGEVAEELHTYGPMVNTYQVSKWSAEQSLHLLALRSPLPVTIFRPSVVIGHRRTGWAHRNGFGFYMFLDAMKAIAQAGHKELSVDIVGDSRPDLISIDQLVADACALTFRQHQGVDFEVFHCTGGRSERMADIVRMWGEVAGIRATLGAPVTTLDQRFDRAIEPNRRFANGDWDFSREKLDGAVGGSSLLQPLALEELRRLCSWYLGTSTAAAVAEVD